MELETKYGRFAESFGPGREKEVWKLSKTNYHGTSKVTREKFFSMLARHIPILATSKDELSPAVVKAFRVDLLNKEPSFEKPIQYSQRLTAVIDQELDSLLA